MALVSTNPSQPGLRVYEPNFASGHPHTEEVAESRSHLLHKIGAIYRKARKRLPHGSRRPQGLCLGLLDPASNIVVNSLVEWKREREGEGSRKSTSTCHVVPQDELERRSLDGLVVFLTRLFPNLSEGLAVCYLRLTNADVLIAACIVLSDHGVKSFCDSGPDDINMSLMCASLAARHPDPYRLLVGMLNYGPPAHEKDVWRAWQLAEASLRHRPCSMPKRHTHLLNRTLQDTIHGYYIQALARLPAGSRFHRGLIRAGHCYGPLNPVSNIIINTIWYDAAFPPVMKLELDVIGTRCLHRVENRSLYGMASFLCTRYHRSNFHRAVRCLLQADANLVLADPNLDPPAHAAAVFAMGGGVLRHAPAADLLCRVHAHGAPDTSLEEAYLAAATAACHPNPDAQVKLLMSCRAMLGPALSVLHPDSGKLSPQDVQQLAKLLCPESPDEYDCESELPPVPLKCFPRAELADLYTLVSKEVKALLNKYQQMPNGDPKFELHTICGVNDRVYGASSWPSYGHGHGHSHVNFVATPKSPCGGVPTLFFAEINDNDRSMSFCCPVALPLPCAAQIRCVYCEPMGTRIVHPVGIHFHGRDMEFEKMACEKDPLRRMYATLRIINQRTGIAESVHANVKEDSLYDGVDGQKSEYEIDRGSLSMQEYILLIPACGYQ
ncbi:hypothetical protein VPH35_107833 [Triticum aestivum]